MYGLTYSLYQPWKGREGGRHAMGFIPNPMEFYGFSVEYQEAPHAIYADLLSAVGK